MFQRVFVAVLLALALTKATPIKKAPIQLGCQACHPVDPEKINVHLIPHSHDDVGWLKTLDQYYYGSHNEIQNAGVQYIISSTVEALKANPDRRFIQVETAFFWKWWQRQNDATRQDVVDLVESGRLEMTNAAWSMNDEAAVNYQSTIDQFTLGLATINETLGKCGIPRVGWQIDPFGHSREQASIFSQLGFEGVFFARIDYADKNRRIEDKTMEVIWKGSASLDNTNIFTNMFPEFYYPLQGFCFDVNCADETINDDVNSPFYNIPQKVADFGNQMLQLATYYRTNNLLIPMGGDFQYQSAERNFINTDRLIHAFKDHEQINLIYSTPTCYLKAVNEAAQANNIDFALKTDDFFPYASDTHQYWTGYFTSRPNAKRFERFSNNILQGGKQVATYSKVTGHDITKDLRQLREAMGVLQHHDAITGTAKAAVAKDYSRLLTKGINIMIPSVAESIETLLTKTGVTNLKLDLNLCLAANVSICASTDSDDFVVVVQNPLERLVTHHVRVPVPSASYKITGPKGEETVDVMPAISEFNYLDGFDSPAKPKELVFAAQVPPLGFTVYVVQKSDKPTTYKPTATTKFGTNETGFEISPTTGLLSYVTINGRKLAISQEFRYYEGSTGNQNGDYSVSGAYLFRPLNNKATPVADSVSVTATIGNLVDEVKQTINDWITQIIRVYKTGNDDYIEFDWLIGPIETNTATGRGREIVTVFTVQDFDSNQTFYTDSNGRESIRRVLNQRYDYEYDSTLEPVSSNYYPITSKLSIRDEKQNVQVSVLNDRAQGGTSLVDGELELMLHRRLLRDDVKGVNEALNDQEFGQPIVARGQLQLTFGELGTTSSERLLELGKLLQPLVWVGGKGLAPEDVEAVYNLEFAGLLKVLPDNVHVLSLEPWQEDGYILRLENFVELKDGSETVTVDLKGLFALFEITEMRETTLGANQWLDEYEKLDKLTWSLESGERTETKKISAEDDLKVTLTPMQIRTFVINVKLN